MAALEDLKGLDLAQAQVILWTVKGPAGPAADAPKYSGRWIDTTDEVDDVLKEILIADLAKTEEVLEYGLLAQNNEASALTIGFDETHADQLLQEIAAELPQKKASTVKHLLNAKFYVAKFIIGEQVIYAVRKTEDGWKTKRALNVRDLYFADQQLALDGRPHFQLSKNFDFFIFGGEILVKTKNAFESFLRYKSEQRQEFVGLQGEAEFLDIFLDVAPLVAYVGDNKIQLRRAFAIRDKGHYKDPLFMQRLRDNQAEYGFGIQFDAQGKIVATPETCAQIMKALLDHRLKSGFSTLIYDVQDTTPVQV
ncbi:Kiwa anti-phage protein KwaB-like domain-containing protein [Neorhizobium tomejilense]|uniref:Kiwa anti-phage protein KwaB-like domain-containing protein n=1 Tax=Neorhizobium tomejilense TaxID=2093828 RepID=UPI00155E8BFD|nr:Kiwa anti-phage protein KwaB-like domain-containing protein [Neorhizobium tomejilense]